MTSTNEVVSLFVLLHNIAAVATQMYCSGAVYWPHSLVTCAQKANRETSNM